MGVLQRTLDAGNVDHRHCVEKKDLAARVHEAFDTLPLPIRSELSSLVQAPLGDVVPYDVHQALAARVARLQPDEQYSVKLFRVRTLACTHC